MVEQHFYPKRSNSLLHTEGSCLGWWMWDHCRFGREVWPPLDVHCESQKGCLCPQHTPTTVGRVDETMHVIRATSTNVLSIHQQLWEELMRQCMLYGLQVLMFLASTARRFAWVLSIHQQLCEELMRQCMLYRLQVLMFSASTDRSLS